MDETEADDVVTVGQRLREARESKGLTVEDIAAQTRIPTRHLSSLETSEWDKLPAATYSIGFAKNYAGAVGLDRDEIGEQLRAEMGGMRPIAAHPEIYEAADPARTMPKGLMIGALLLLAVFVLALMWINNRSLATGEPVAETANVAVPAENSVVPATATATAGPVVLTANEAVWIEVKDGDAVLKQGELSTGQSYEVPANAVAPVLTTGKPEALRISVGTADAPPVGPAGRVVSAASLRAADLLRQPAAAVPAASSTATRPSPDRARPAPPPVELPEPSAAVDTDVAAPAPPTNSAL